MTKGKLHIKVRQGDWMTLPSRVVQLRCCDCGLIHTIQLRLRKTRIAWRFWLDKRSTAQVRRHKRQRKVVRKSAERSQ